MFDAKRVSVDDAPVVKILEGTEASEAVVTNRDATDSVYLGGPAVTDATGYELPAGGSVAVSLGSDGNDLYGVCAAGLAATLHVLLH